jgi:hypothetical protein
MNRTCTIVAASLVVISAAIAQTPFMVASNRYIDIAHAFVTSYNAGNIEESLLLIDYSYATGKDRDAYRLSHLREEITNICCVTPRAFPQSGSTNECIWIQVGTPRLSPQYPENDQLFTLQANGSIRGYLEMRFPLLRGVAPTQARSVVIGLTNPNRDTYDKILNINIDSDR